MLIVPSLLVNAPSAQPIAYSLPALTEIAAAAPRPLIVALADVCELLRGTLPMLAKLKASGVVSGSAMVTVAALLLSRRSVSALLPPVTVAVLMTSPTVRAVVSRVTVAVSLAASVGSTQLTVLPDVVHCALPGVTAVIAKALGTASLNRTLLTGWLWRLRTVSVKRTASPTVAVLLDAVFDTDTLVSVASTAPTSQRVPCGRATPRWSTPLTGSAAQSASEPASMATLPLCRVSVGVGPPLLASMPRLSAATVTGAPPTSRSPLPQLESVARLLRPVADDGKPEQRPASPLTIELTNAGAAPVARIAVAVPGVAGARPVPSALPWTVVLISVSAPLVEMAPPLPAVSFWLAPTVLAVRVLLTITVVPVAWMAPPLPPRLFQPSPARLPDSVLPVIVSAPVAKIAPPSPPGPRFGFDAALPDSRLSTISVAPRAAMAPPWPPMPLMTRPPAFPVSVLRVIVSGPSASMAPPDPAVLPVKASPATLPVKVQKFSVSAPPARMAPPSFPFPELASPALPLRKLRWFSVRFEPAALLIRRTALRPSRTMAWAGSVGPSICSGPPAAVISGSALFSEMTPPPGMLKRMLSGMPMVALAALIASRSLQSFGDGSQKPSSPSDSVLTT